LETGLKTFAVLGHGFSFFYPSQNKKLAREILENGGALITEYTRDTKPDGFNFVKRNRIIAGMTQGTLIVETATKGGSLITANLALSYSREVMAIPGRA
jgi:DNA processing protein